MSLHTPTITLEISPEIHKEYPGVVICVAQAEIPSNYIAEPIEISPPETMELATEHVDFWHSYYRKFGINPKRNKPSFEALTLRYKKKGIIPVINPIVDLYNRLSIKYQIPIGAFATEKLDSVITLRLSREGEIFQGIGEEEAESIPNNTVIYAIDNSVISTGWNYRDADISKVIDDTMRVTFISESSVEHQPRMVEAMTELNSLLPLQAVTYYRT